MRKSERQNGGFDLVDHPEVAFGEDGALVSLWVGTFGSEKAAEAYTEEQYGEERDEEPISPFAADIGLRFYDHDFLEQHYEPNLSAQGVAALVDHSHGESFAATAWSAIQNQRVVPFDTVLLLYGYDHTRYPQARRRPKRVKFVGTFPYRADA